jgi:hypothetical protein
MSANNVPFVEFIEFMMAICGPEMKHWMGACTSNNDGGSSCCSGTQSRKEAAEYK